MILVTGATGTIGKATVAALKATGTPFKVGLRSPDKAKALGVDAVSFNWDDPSTYVPAMKGAERVFLLTGATEKAHGYTLLAVAAAKRAGVKHLVRVSVIGANVEPGIALGRQHRACERELEQSGLAWTMLRPTFFMQNFFNFYGVTRENGGTVYLANGSGQVSWVDARDVGAVAAQVLTGKGHEGKAYDLTGGEALSTAQACEQLSAALGKACTYVDVPEEAARQAMEGMGIPPWYADGLGELAMLIRMGYAAGVANGVSDVLGRAPTSFAAWAASMK
jgi:uncharacterized protein YbjT (DUF2867 family)